MTQKFFMAVTILALICSSAHGEISKETVESAFKRIAKADSFQEVPINYENDDSPNVWVAFKSKDDYTIHVTTGLMKILNTEDEMAWIWGHEIGCLTYSP